MFIDSSAVVEYLLALPEADAVADRIQASQTRFVTTPTVVFEATIVLSSRLKCTIPHALAVVQTFFAELEVEVIAISADMGLVAIDAFDRYGKGRGDPAQLNFGDCFSYAGCKMANMPLLFVGNDFSKTDLG